VPKPLPYYPFYVDDFDEDPNVLAMNLSEVGLYILALNESWKRGSIPSDPAALAIMIRRKPAEVKRAWPKVEPCWIKCAYPGRLVNPRQERERASALEKSAKASLSAQSRYGPPANAGANADTDVGANAYANESAFALPRAFESVSVSSPALEPSPEENTSTRARGPLVDYDTIVARFSHHRGMKKPNKATVEQGRYRWSGADMDEEDLAAALEGYRASDWGKREGYPFLGFIKKPQSWISAPVSDQREDKTKATLEAKEWEQSATFMQFVGEYEKPGITATEWDRLEGYPYWLDMPDADRALAIERVASAMTDNSYPMKIKNYLLKKEYTRKPRPKPRSRSGDLEGLAERTLALMKKNKEAQSR